MAAKTLQETMKAEFETLPIWPKAHIHIDSSVTDTIATINVWQKVDLSTGTPDIRMQGGFTWDAVNKRIVWDANDDLDHDLECLFIGDAQIQITSAISGTESLQLGLVINGGAPVVITPISFTQQSKINGFGANHDFSNHTSPTPSDSRLVAGDYIEIFIRSTTNEPSFQMDELNVTFAGR